MFAAPGRAGYHSQSGKCAQEYDERASEYLDISGLPATYLNARRGVMVNLENEANAIEEHADVASSAVVACWILGGRSWEIEFDIESYVNRVGRQEPEQAKSFAAILGEDAFTSSMRGIFCAPYVCNNRTLGQIVLSRYLAKLIGRPRAPIVAPLHGLEVLGVLELSHWSTISLDFVVAGLNRCGTTSAHLNLLKHPNISFTWAHAEDWSLFVGGQKSKLVPLKSQTEAFNIQSDVARNSGTILGLKNPSIYQNPLAFNALAQIPGLRVIVVACDPLSRLERLFMANYCNSNLQVALGNSEANQRLQGQCDGSAAALLTDRYWEWIAHENELGFYLSRLHKHFRGRLKLVHQSDLRKAATFDELALWLGASRFPASTDFRRYGYWLGHRTDLCFNITLQIALKHLLEPQYQALEAAFQKIAGYVPSELLQRETRCDRQDDLFDGGACGVRDISNQVMARMRSRPKVATFGGVQQIPYGCPLSP